MATQTIWMYSSAIFFNANNDKTLIDRVYSIDSLTITNGAGVINSTDNGATNDHELIVNGATTVSGAGSSILIYGGDPDGLDTNTLTINSGASVILNSTTNSGTAVVEVDGGAGAASLIVSSGGTLIGTGRIDLESALGSPTIVLTNDGAIIANTPTFFFGLAPNPGTLQITANDVDARFNWDGGGSGVLQANGNQTLDIDVDPGVDGFGGTMNLSTGSTIDIANTWELDSGTINANTAAFGLIIIGQDPLPGAAARIAGGSWTMSGGTINVDDSWDSLQFDSQLTTTGGTIANSGTIIFNSSATIGSGTDFQMNGNHASITVNDGVTVNIDDANFNADGSGFATNVVTIGDNGRLDLDVDFTFADEDFDGTINLNGGELNVTNTNGVATANWRINSSATVNVNDAVNTSDMDGSNLEIFGTINVNADADLLINPVSTAFRGSANINVAAGASLNVSGPSSYESGVVISGAGTFRPGTATIGVDAANTQNVVWGTAFVDYDDGDHTINDGSSLTINADSIEAEGSSDGIDNDTTIVDDGVLTFNLIGGAPVVFDVSSTLTYDGDTTLDTFLGAGTSPIEFHGIMNINGDGEIEPRIDFDDAFVSIIDAGERLRLSGGNQLAGSTNTINNSTIDGPGTLQLDNGTALRGSGTINAVIDDNGSADIIAEGGTLNIGGSIDDIGLLGTSGAGSELNVSNPWNTATTQVVRLSRGRLTGSSITNDGVNGIRGQGLLAARVQNNTVIASDSGGVLVVETALNNNDWDGAGNTGTLRATSGTLELRDTAPFLFNGTVQAVNATVFANGFELEFDPASTLTLDQGVYRSSHATDIGGTVNVQAGGTSILQVNGTTVFESTSSTTLNDTLRLEDGSTVVQVGASFAGGGTLQVAGSQVLTLEDGANVNVLVENEGRLALGASPGQATVLDYQQEAIGLLEIELEGTGLNDYDRLTATGLAQLDGLLELSLIGGFNPTLNDTFTVLSAAAGVNGVFNAMDFSAAALDPGLMWDVVYNPTNVQLEVVEVPMFSADFDNDGDVDGDDLAQWEGDFGGPGSDADMDGDSDGSDFLDWQRQFGSGVPPLASVQGSAVPEPSTLLLAGLALSCGLMMPRKRK